MKRNRAAPSGTARFAVCALSMAGSLVEQKAGAFACLALCFLTACREEVEEPEPSPTPVIISGGDDTITLLNLIKRGSNLGIAVPEKVGDFSYVVEYKDYPLFDVIEIKLVGADSPLGKEF